MSADEFVAMEESVHRAKALGLAGVVFGLLLESGEVDVVRTRRLVELAKVDGLEVTFHRAIDETPLPLRALEDVIGCGVDRVLTSGGAVDVIAGMDELEEMTRVAAGRVVVAAGGGVRVANASLLAGRGLCDLHGTLGLGSVRVEDVRGVVEVLKGAR
jgi:copper homeostasis protein